MLWGRIHVGLLDFLEQGTGMSENEYQALSRVEEDVKNGDLGKARDRLHSLIQNHPSDTSLRSRLAGIYWQIRLPVEAGRYWYLEESRSEEEEMAVDIFKKNCGYRAGEILRRLKLKVDTEQLDTSFAREQVQELERLSREDGEVPPSDKKARERLERRKKLQVENKRACWGIATFLIILAVAFVATVDLLVRQLIDKFR
jgi:hypothetical protein